jgi:hypothetical protein
MSKTRKTPTRGAGTAKKATKRTATPRARKAKKELTADELLMRAWEYTYKNRHKRLD